MDTCSQTFMIMSSNELNKRCRCSLYLSEYEKQCKTGCIRVLLAFVCIIIGISDSRTRDYMQEHDSIKFNFKIILIATVQQWLQVIVCTQQDIPIN